MGASVQIIFALHLLGIGLPESAGQIVRETWDSVYLGSQRAGFVRTTVREVFRDGQMLLHAECELQLTLKRQGGVTRLRSIDSTEETIDGKVKAVGTRHWIGTNQQLVIEGIVRDNELHLQVDQGKRERKRKPWDPKVVGLARQENLFRERKVKPGDSFVYSSYVPLLTHVITNQVTVQGHEQVTLLGGKQRRLLRVDCVPQEVQGVQLPPTTVWLDETWTPICSRYELPEFGQLTLYRSTRKQALQPITSPPDPAHGLAAFVPLKRTLPRRYDTAFAVYRIFLEVNTDPSSLIPTDERQRILEQQGTSVLLEVRSRREPSASRAEEPGQEFLGSSYFVNARDPRVRELARLATRESTDPWEKAKRIESWVHRNMNSRTFTETFATADETARTLQGDCTEHAMLCAAMCRAVGVPSRTAIGLVYVERSGRPFMGFHMWTEVHVQGGWMPIDGTVGRGFVGATHIKLLDHSWHETDSLTPLLPLMKVMGKLRIEIETADGNP